MLNKNDIDQKVDNLTITEQEIKDLISDLVTIKFKDPQSASEFLPVIAKYCLFTGKKTVIKSLFYLCDSFKIERENIIIDRYVHYTLFIVYFAMSFYPKAIEHGLLLEKKGFNYPFMELNTYKFMSNMCISLKMYEKAMRYNKKSINAVKKYFKVDSDTYREFEIFYYNDTLLINTYLKNHFSASIAKQKLRERIESYPNEDVRNELISYLSFSVMLYHKIFDDQFDVDFYINTMKELMNKKTVRINAKIVVDEHVQFIRLLKDSKHLEEAFDICQFIINSQIFLGDRAPIYNELFNFFDGNMLKNNIKELGVFIKKYRSLVNEYTVAKSEMCNILASEEFKIHDLKNNIKNLEDKYKRDALTGCLNRHLIENDWNNLDKKNGEINIAFLDLDNLKYVNDSLGHEAGDVYIKSFVNGIKSGIDNTQYFYRYGGDEFLIISTLRKDVLEEQMQDLLENVEVQEFPSFSFGISTYNVDSTSLQSLISIADERMYAQKKQKKNKYA